MSIWTIFCPFTPRNNSEKKSVSGSRTLPLVIFDKKVLFFPKIALLKVYMGNTFQKVPFFEDSGCCPKILDTILCSPLTNLKNEKKTLEISSSFYTNVPKIMIICYTVPEIQCMMDGNFCFSFWAIFLPLTPPLL